MAASGKDIKKSAPGMPDHVVWSLPASWYRDPEIWNRERKQIFAREWLWIGREDQLRKSGDYVTASPAGFPVFVIRHADGSLRGFHNVCRHRAAKILLDDAGHCDALRCPYHAWLYDFEGRLKNAPNFGETPDFPGTKLSLWPVRVATWLGLLFINMDEASPPLEQCLGAIKSQVEKYAPPAMVFDREITTEVPCNWKNYVDNYQEGYHIPQIHPTLRRDLAWQDYRIINTRHGSLHDVEPRKGSGQPGVFGWQFPNFTFNFYFNGVSFMRMDPLQPNRIRLVYNVFRPENVAREDFEKVIDYGRRVSEEDQQITPLIQENLNAGVYDVGPLSPRHENGLYHFHEMVRAALGK